MINMKETNMPVWRQPVRQLIDFDGFKEYTPIQKQAIPAIMQGKDVIGIAPTGTGKTHAYLLPLMQKLDVTSNHVQAVIMAPTRELAKQIYQRASELVRFEPQARIKLISSGMDKERMISSLNVQFQLVIGTVGRLRDLFVDTAVLRLNSASIMVIDEADMLLELGFLPQVDEICGRMSADLQMLVFSATIPAQMQPFLRKYMHNPVTISCVSDKQQPKIEHILINCRHLSYQEKLLKILPGFQPYTCLIFARTKAEATKTATVMKENGYQLIEIHGDMTPRQRQQALRAIKAEKTAYIVATDMMARGIDIPSVSHVVSLGLPSQLEYYTHRAGRTGRAGRDGICYTLYNSDDISGLKTLRSSYGISFTYRDFRSGQWFSSRPFDYKRPKPQTAADVEIKKIINKPVKQVKPGYKKKRQAEIDKIRRKQHRQKIKDYIKAEQHERAKQKQREKGGY